MKRTTGALCFGFLPLVCLAFGSGFAHADTIYVSNSANGTIEKFDSNGNGSLFATNLATPTGLALDNAGNLYVANWGGTILKFDSGGNVSRFATAGVSQPYGLAFDGNGNLYVANNANNTIEKFDSGGHGSLFASAGLNEPGFIAVQVPEPNTWVLLVLGAGALLCGLRLRRGSTVIHCYSTEELTPPRLRSGPFAGT